MFRNRAPLARVVAHMGGVHLRSDRVSAHVATQHCAAAALVECAGAMARLPGCASLAAEVQAWAQRSAEIADRIAAAVARSAESDAATVEMLDRS